MYNYRCIYQKSSKIPRCLAPPIVHFLFLLSDVFCPCYPSLISLIHSLLILRHLSPLADGSTQLTNPTFFSQRKVDGQQRSGEGEKHWSSVICWENLSLLSFVKNACVKSTWIVRSNFGLMCPTSLSMYRSAFMYRLCVMAPIKCRCFFLIEEKSDAEFLHRLNTHKKTQPTFDFWGRPTQQQSAAWTALSKSPSWPQQTGAKHAR